MIDRLNMSREATTSQSLASCLEITGRLRLCRPGLGLGRQHLYICSLGDHSKWPGFCTARRKELVLKQRRWSQGCRQGVGPQVSNIQEQRWQQMNKLTLTTGHCWGGRQGMCSRKSQLGSGQLGTGPGVRCFAQVWSHLLPGSPGTTPGNSQQACQPWEVAAHCPESEAQESIPGESPKGRSTDGPCQGRRQGKVLV